MLSGEVPDTAGRVGTRDNWHSAAFICELLQPTAALEFCGATVNVSVAEVAGGVGAVARVTSAKRTCMSVPVLAPGVVVKPGCGTRTSELGIWMPFTNTFVVDRKFDPVKYTS